MHIYSAPGKGYGRSTKQKAKKSHSSIIFFCCRIGAVHSIVFGGYSADSLAARILDAGSRVLITADGVYRGTKLIKLLEIAHHAMDKVIQYCTYLSRREKPKLVSYSNGSAQKLKRK